MKTSDRSALHPVLRLFSNQRRRIRAALLLSVFLCCSMSWLHFEQRRALDRETAGVEAIRQARIDLAEGFLHAFSAGDAGSSRDRDRGLGEMGRAVSALESISAAPGPGEEEIAQALHGNLHAFRGLLGEKGGSGLMRAGWEARLRAAFLEVEGNAAVIDVQRVGSLRELAERLDRRFTAAMGLAGLLLAGACLVVFFSIREGEKAESAWRAAQKALRERELISRSLVEHLPHRIFIKDRDSVYVWCNAEYGRDLGLAPESIAGKDDFAFYTRELAERYRADDRTGMASGELKDIEEPYLVEGEERWVRTVKVPYRDEAGQAVGVLGMFEDVTEKKRAEDALRESQEHYRSLFDNMLNGFAYCRMIFEGDRPVDFVYLEVNGAFENLTGLKNVAGKRVSGVIPGIRESDPELFEIYGRVALTGLPERFESYVASLEMWFAISVYSLRKECFVAVFDVVTERKRAEAALRASLEEKVALLKEVHHRVKNNLQIVASLLSLQAGRASSPEAVDVLQDTRNRVRSMALLHELLYRSGNLANIDFAAYVRELCLQLVRSFGPAAARIGVETRIVRIKLPLEQAVPCGLIISELVSNAFKHGFPGDRAGRVEVELGPEERNGERFVLRVRDDGAGLSPGFDIADDSTLGLQLVSNLSGQLGGNLSAERPPGGGVAFSVVFPAPGGTYIEGES